MRLTLFSSLIIPLVVGCGDTSLSKYGSECGEDTRDIDGICVPIEDTGINTEDHDTGDAIDPPVDNDGDGVAESDDCDDTDALLGAQAEDAD